MVCSPDIFVHFLQFLAATIFTLTSWEFHLYLRILIVNQGFGYGLYSDIGAHLLCTSLTYEVLLLNISASFGLCFLLPQASNTSVFCPPEKVGELIQLFKKRRRKAASSQISQCTQCSCFSNVDSSMYSHCFHTRCPGVSPTHTQFNSQQAFGQILCSDFMFHSFCNSLASKIPLTFTAYQFSTIFCYYKYCEFLLLYSWCQGEFSGNKAPNLQFFILQLQFYKSKLSSSVYSWTLLGIYIFQIS